MPVIEYKKPKIIRLSAIFLLAFLSLSAITYSSRSVRYPVDGVSTTEFAITKLSLTHSVERGLDGKLTNPYAGEESLLLNNAHDLRPVLVASVAYNLPLQELAAKKITPKKPEPKKPAPKKPSPKKPGKGKACPT